ncbi:MAG: hypothetical protein B6D61_01435 [Bacteroidetes bacterium 4484_249]|nr:MAG: hypothetical protein B6D61_01435 [Bacteroidetes bacterium 4484_249]
MVLNQFPGLFRKTCNREGILDNRNTKFKLMLEETKENKNPEVPAKNLKWKNLKQKQKKRQS